jgi:DUF971 family protein
MTVTMTTTPVAPTVTAYDVSPDLASLSMTTLHGDRVSLTAEKLRIACKCAHCLRARIDERFPERFPGLAIVEVADLGYGLNIAFSDGHNRGIYPKSYLLDLADS